MGRWFFVVHYFCEVFTSSATVHCNFLLGSMRTSLACRSRYRGTELRLPLPMGVSAVAWTSNSNGKSDFVIETSRTPSEDKNRSIRLPFSYFVEVRFAVLGTITQIRL